MKKYILTIMSLSACMASCGEFKVKLAEDYQDCIEFGDLNSGGGVHD